MPKNHHLTRKQIPPVSSLALAVAPLHSRDELISLQRAQTGLLDNSYQSLNSGGPPVSPATSCAPRRSLPLAATQTTLPANRNARSHGALD